MKTTNPFRRNAAVLAAAAVVGGLGIGGLAAANATSGDTGPAPSQVQPANQSDGDGEAIDATEVEGAEEAEEAEDGPDQGPDANPDQPGHQDTNQGPDANPDEPGHQDADESGETN